MIVYWPVTTPAYLLVYNHQSACLPGLNLASSPTTDPLVSLLLSGHWGCGAWYTYQGKQDAEHSKHTGFQKSKSELVQTNIKHWLKRQWSWDTKSLPLGGWKEDKNNNKASIWQIFLSYKHLPCSVFQHERQRWTPWNVWGGESNVDYQETHVSPTSINLRRHFSYVYLKKRKLSNRYTQHNSNCAQKYFSRTNQWVSRQRCIPCDHYRYHPGGSLPLTS